MWKATRAVSDLEFERDEERALADDLAGVLDALVADYPWEVGDDERAQRVLARWREARGMFARVGHEGPCMFVDGRCTGCYRLETGIR